MPRLKDQTAAPCVRRNSVVGLPGGIDKPCAGFFCHRCAKIKSQRACFSTATQILDHDRLKQSPLFRRHECDGRDRQTLCLRLPHNAMRVPDIAGFTARSGRDLEKLSIQVELAGRQITRTPRRLRKAAAGVWRKTESGDSGGGFVCFDGSPLVQRGRSTVKIVKTMADAVASQISSPGTGGSGRTSGSAKTADALVAPSMPKTVDAVVPFTNERRLSGPRQSWAERPVSFLDICHLPRNHMSRFDNLMIKFLNISSTIIL